MSAVWLLLICLACCLQTSLVQSDESDSDSYCPIVSPLPTFDLDKFLGNWFEQASFGTDSFRPEMRCVETSYTYDEDADEVEVLNKGIPIGTEDFRITIGSLEYKNPYQKNGDLIVKLNITGNRLRPAPLRVLATDYNNYAVLHSCTVYCEQVTESVYLITRIQDLSYSPEWFRRYIQFGFAVGLRFAEILRSDFTNTDQKNCPRTID